MKFFKGRWLIGLLIIGFGVTLLLENLGIANIDFGLVMSFFFSAFFIIWGIEMIFNRQGLGSILTGFLLIFLGGSILGNSLEWFYVDLSIIFKIFWPIIFILIGINIIRASKPRDKSKIAFMGGIEHKESHWKLEGGSYMAIMGGIELDLRMAEIPEGETHIDLTTIMGGIDLLVPDNVTVYCSGSVILGGLEFFERSSGGLISSLKAEQIRNSNKIIYIKSSAIMGGIEIKRTDNFYQN